MQNSFVWLIAGVVSLVGGTLALLNPLSASITATNLAGWVLLIVGCLQAYSAWVSQGFRARTGAGLSAAAALLMGASLVFGAFGDGSMLRILLSLLLFASGAAKLWSARQIRGDGMAVAVTIAGTVSLILGVVLLTGFLGSFAGRLGLILGAELLANGVALIVLALRWQKIAPRA